jgi:hypothetical protein
MSLLGLPCSLLVACLWLTPCKGETGPWFLCLLFRTKTKGAYLISLMIPRCYPSPVLGPMHSGKCLQYLSLGESNASHPVALFCASQWTHRYSEHWSPCQDRKWTTSVLCTDFPKEQERIPLLFRVEGQLILTPFQADSQSLKSIPGFEVNLTCTCFCFFLIFPEIGK